MKSLKLQDFTSFLIDLSASISKGSIMRSLNALRRWKTLKDVSYSTFLSPSSSIPPSLSSMSNKSVSHLDQLPIWQHKEKRAKNFNQEYAESIIFIKIEIETIFCFHSFWEVQKTDFYTFNIIMNKKVHTNPICHNSRKQFKLIPNWSWKEVNFKEEIFL